MDTKATNEDIKLIPLQKGVYNSELRLKTMLPYIYVSTTSNLRFSTAFVKEFNIRGGEKMNFFTDESGKRIFFQIAEDGQFEIQKHARKRNGKDHTEYVGASSSLRFAINNASKASTRKSVKLFLSKYIENLNCYELEVLPILTDGRGRKKNEK